MKDATEFLSTVPVLPALDLDTTVSFYEERLGFKVAFSVEDYAGMSRDGVLLHFWLCNNRLVAENSGCRIGVKGIEKLYEACREDGIVHPNAPLAEKPWGTREFAITDPSGNLLTFVESP